MEYEQEQQWVADIKKYVADNLPLSKMGDDELKEAIKKHLLDNNSRNC